MHDHLDILVVDDWIDSAESLAELIRIWGFEARTAYSGPAALEAAHVKPPDVVFMDISMPRMDGLETARRLRQEHPEWPMKLIALTGHGAESACNETIKTAFHHHLVKPADPEQICQILHQLVKTRIQK